MEPARLVGDMGIRGNIFGIKKVEIYQNFTTVTNPDISINTVGRESAKKH